MTGTRQRTYTRVQLDESRAAWDAGDFSAEWREWRRLAGQVGIIAAPVGTKWDQWDDDQPSERAILIRAIREQPDALRRILRTGHVGAWSNVIALLVRERDRHADDIDERERHIDAEITHQQARDTLRRVGIVLGRTA